ncbi:MAG: creatininase family protein [Planctomycetes bacterium]|nr:creatininase family protein [Planctomycetota bacterium]
MTLSAEFLRPGEILKAREASSCAFIPISPCFEWHSYHLPMAVDALIAEESSKRMAEHFHGIYFRCLSCGLDVFRNDAEKNMWGLTGDVFGMRFPELPISSEYATKDDMRQMLDSRLEAVQQSGFKHIFVVNHHGGQGQQASVDEICNDFGKKHEMQIHSLNTVRLTTIGSERPEIQFRIGGHAGLSETLYVMGFRPELVDTDQLDEGPLQVNTSGILHSAPEIEAEFNPRECKQEDAEAMVNSLITNMIAAVEERVQ